MGNDETGRRKAERERLEAAVESDLGRLGRDVAEAADALSRGASKLLSDSPELARAAEGLRGSIRKSPLAAIGIAFFAGLLLALLTRG